MDKWIRLLPTVRVGEKGEIIYTNSKGEQIEFGRDSIHLKLEKHRKVVSYKDIASVDINPRFKIENDWTLFVKTNEGNIEFLVDTSHDGDWDLLAVYDYLRRLAVTRR